MILLTQYDPQQTDPSEAVQLRSGRPQEDWRLRQIDRRIER